MKKLLEALDAATNVQSLRWDRDSQLWQITYKEYGLEPDLIDSDSLIDFLKNA